MDKKFDIVVVGSINMDLYFEINRDPVLGETIQGENFNFLQGGKGANQAIAAAKLGNKVAMIGCIGVDTFGKIALKNFEKYKVDHSQVKIVDTHTGVARVTIHTHKRRNNSIVVIPGANLQITKKMIDDALPIIQSAKIVLIQLEIPMEIVEYVVHLCNKNEIDVIINPAPYHQLNQDTFDQSTFIIPNEIEVSQMFPNHSIELSCAQYPNKLIVTRGSLGVEFHNRIEFRMIPGLKTNPVDTTGAGDVFIAAFASSYIKKQLIEDSIIYANICAGISTLTLGAQESSPSQKDVEAYMKAHPKLPKANI